MIPSSEQSKYPDPSLAARRKPLWTFLVGLISSPFLISAASSDFRASLTSDTSAAMSPTFSPATAARISFPRPSPPESSLPIPAARIFSNSPWISVLNASTASLFACSALTAALSFRIAISFSDASLTCCASAFALATIESAFFLASAIIDSASAFAASTPSLRIEVTRSWICNFLDL